MPAPFPHHYELSLTRTARAHATVELPGRPPVAGAAPPEFDGDPAAWSPEHLLLAAIGLCHETTFDAYATRDGLAIERWHATVSGTLEKTKAGLAFTRFTITVEVTVAPGDVERARSVLDRAHRACIVSNALNVPVEVDAQVSATPRAA